MFLQLVQLYCRIFSRRQFHIFPQQCSPDIISGKFVWRSVWTGSIQIRMAYLFSPQIWTPLTPGMVCNLSTSTLLAYSVISSGFRVLLCTVMIRMGSELASALETTGGASRSAGNERCACDTLSRTSLAAASRSITQFKFYIDIAGSWLLLEVIFFIPAIPLTAFSSGSVICVSMISALAPG